MEEERLRTIRKDNRRKAVIGLLLLIALGLFVWRHVDLGGLPYIGMVIAGPSKECIETRGPKVMTDTVVEQLKVQDGGFEVKRDRNTAELTVKNIDDKAGDVQVRVYCKDGEEQGRETKNIPAGKEETFLFEGVKDCDLEYLVEPQLMTTKVNRTVYTEDVTCD